MFPVRVVLFSPSFPPVFHRLSIFSTCFEPFLLALGPILGRGRCQTWEGGIAGEEGLDAGHSWAFAFLRGFVFKPC